jgi:hypothetical protein
MQACRLLYAIRNLSIRIDLRLIPEIEFVNLSSKIAARQTVFNALLVISIFCSILLGLRFRHVLCPWLLRLPSAFH